MVWAGLSLGALRELHILDIQTLTTERYADDIFQEYAVPFAHFIGDAFLLLHDNGRPHIAAVVHLFAVNTKSCDLNPIENV